LNIKTGFDKDMTAGLLQEIQPFKGSAGSRFNGEITHAQMVLLSNNISEVTPLPLRI